MGEECCFNVISRFFGNERHVTRERTPSRETTRNTMSIQHNLVMTSLHWYDIGRDDFRLLNTVKPRQTLQEPYKKSVLTGLFSASFQIFCLTARAYLNTQKYGLFCSLILQNKVYGQLIYDTDAAML